MAITLLTLLAKLGLDTSAFEKGMDEAVKKSSSGSSSLVKNLSTAGAVATGGLAAGAVAALGLGTAITKASIDAAPLAGIQAAYEGITGGGEDMLAMLREKSAGMVTDRDLMTSYNQAAGLVSKTFADQLPDAMGYLGKVSAATGEDMGYLMDSLVKGVGRLSPMILDNLGIQVNLAEANEAYAASIGKTVGELTKEEQQAALMDQVMEKLAANTANMPEVTGTAAQSLAAIGVLFKNLKDEIGLAFLPVLQMILTAFGELAREYGPQVAEMLKGLVPPLLAFVENVIAYIPVVIQTFKDVVAWLQEHEGVIVGVLVALGAAIGAFVYTTVIPAAAAAIGALAPIALPILAIAAVVALLYEAWQNDWGGIQTFLTNVWENYLQPAFKAMSEWLSVNIPKAIDALTKAFNWVKDHVLAPVAEAFDKIGEAIESVIGWVGRVGEKLGGLKNSLPDWLVPGSPTPFELGLRGIANAMSDMARLELPRLEAGLQFDPATANVQEGSAGGGTTFNISIDLRGGTSDARRDASIGVLEALRAAGVA